MTLISIILIPNSQHTFDILDIKEGGLLYQGGHASVTVKQCRTLEVASFLRLPPFVRSRKEPRTKCPFRIIRLTFPLCLNKFTSSFVKVAFRISVILKCHPLFRVNLLYSKIVFHRVCVDSSRLFSNTLIPCSVNFLYRGYYIAARRCEIINRAFHTKKLLT